MTSITVLSLALVLGAPHGATAGPAAPPSADAEGPDSTLTVARLQYDGGGDWYADPSSLPNLLEAVRDRTGLPVSGRAATVRPLDPTLPDFPYLYMTGHGNVRFSPEERAALREYLLSGGFLHADDNYGMDESFRREMGAVFPDKELVPIPADHPVFHTVYDLPDGLPKIHEHDGEPARAYGIFHRGRLLVFYSHETDLGDGWEDPGVHDNPPELREQALQMGVNIFAYALGQAVP